MDKAANFFPSASKLLSLTDSSSCSLFWNKEGGSWPLGVPDRLTDVLKAAFSTENSFFIVIIILCDLQHVPTSLWA